MALDPLEIYYGVGGARQGPVEIDALRARLASGSLSIDDFVWDDDLDEWMPIRVYPALLDDRAVEAGDDGLRALEDAPRATTRNFAPGHLRFAAWMLDSFLMSIPAMIWEITVESLLGVAFEDLPTLEPMSPIPPQTLEFLLWFHGGMLVLAGLYWTLMESSKWQGTVGKKLLGLVVTDEAGRRATPQRAFVRYLGRLVCVLTFWIGYLLILFDERRQGLHDRIAQTFVVRS